MKCPVLTHDEEFIPNGIKYTPKECLKEECAVWDEQLECCPLVSLRVALKALFDVLSTISRKMPYEGQFRK